MKSLLLLLLQTVLIVNVKSFLHSKKGQQFNTSDYRSLSAVKIYSNLAEIIQPLGKLPLEFSAEDWTDIRPDSITLIGKDVNVSQQSITEKKTPLNGVQVHVRSPSSSDKETKFVLATVIDEKINLVKITDKDISKDPVFVTVSQEQIVYNEEPPKSKYYVNFTYDTTEAVSVSYLRSNLNWKTRYHLYLFEESMDPVLIAMADIRNDGKSKIDIEHAELLGGDINLRMYEHQQWDGYGGSTYASATAFSYQPPASPSMVNAPPALSQGEEVAGLYVFPINKPFSIDAKTNYLIPMFRPRVTVERYSSITKTFYAGTTTTKGKARRSYSLSSDRFLSKGNCILREYDRLVGETKLPDLAAKDKNDFSIGEDPDVIYKENATLVSSRPFTESSRQVSKDANQRTQSVYDISVVLKNYKKNRRVKVKYEQTVYGYSVKFTAPTPLFTTEGSTIKCTTALAPDEEKVLKYTVQVVN